MPLVSNQTSQNQEFNDPDDSDIPFLGRAINIFVLEKSRMSLFNPRASGFSFRQCLDEFAMW